MSFSVFAYSNFSIYLEVFKKLLIANIQLYKFLNVFGVFNTCIYISQVKVNHSLVEFNFKVM